MQSPKPDGADMPRHTCNLALLYQAHRSHATGFSTNHTDSSPKSTPAPAAAPAAHNHRGTIAAGVPAFPKHTGKHWALEGISVEIAPRKMVQV
jgi:hypothetical protein